MRCLVMFVTSSETQGFKGDGKGRERLGAGKMERGEEGKYKGKGDLIFSFHCLVLIIII